MREYIIDLQVLYLSYLKRQYYRIRDVTISKDCKGKKGALAE